MMLGHADVERWSDQNIGGFLRLVRDDFGTEPVGAEQARGSVLLVGSDRNDDGP